jgi:hypothetical protein
MFDDKQPERSFEVKRTILAAVAAMSLSCISAIAVASDRTADATVDLTAASVAAGVGVDWGQGTLHYNGRDIPVKVKGLSLVRVGASKITASGEVYNLKQLSDFGGNYSAVAAGAALAGGAGVAAMRNEHGVVMQLHSTTVGVDLDLGVKGLEVSVPGDGKAAGDVSRNTGDSQYSGA